MASPTPRRIRLRPKPRMPERRKVYVYEQCDLKTLYDYYPPSRGGLLFDPFVNSHYYLSNHNDYAVENYKYELKAWKKWEAENRENIAYTKALLKAEEKERKLRWKLKEAANALRRKQKEVEKIQVKLKELCG